MKRFVLLGLLLVAAVLVYFLTRGADRDAVVPSQLDPAVTTETRERSELVEPEDETTIDSSFASSRDEAAVPETPASGRPALRGRFLFPDETPAPGVALRVHGSAANSDRVREHGSPANWTNPTGTSGADGTFELFFDPPQAFQFSLDADLESYAIVRWRWSELPPDETTDVGDVVLETAGTIVGTVVDSEGVPFTSGWRVYANAKNSNLPGRDSARRTANLDPVTGEFRIEGMPRGRAQLKAHSRVANWLNGPSIDVRPGEVTRARIRYDGPDLRKRITVITFVHRFGSLKIPSEAMKVYRGGEHVANLEKLEGSSQSYVAEGLDPEGVYTVEIDDPRFVKWTKSDVRTGTSNSARLRGSSSLALEVRDASTGMPLDSYTLFTRAESFRTYLHESPKPPPEDGLFPHLLAEPQTLVVSCEGFLTSSTHVEDFRPLETYSLSVDLVPGTTLSGTTIRGDGSRIPGVVIHTAEGQIGPSDWKSYHDGWGSSRIKSDVLSTTSDENGEFSVRGLFPGSWSIEARWSSLIVYEQVEIAGPGDHFVDLRFDGFGALQGKLTTALNVDLSGYDVWAIEKKHVKNLQSPLFIDDVPPAQAKTDAEGRFELDPITVGEMSVLLALPEQSIPSTYSSGGFLQPPWLHIGDVKIVDGEVKHATFDVTDIIPGALEVHFRINGEPAAGAVVAVSCTDDPRRGKRATTVNADGVARIERAFPGEYHIESYTLDRGWKYRSSQAVRISAGGLEQFDVDLDLVEAEVTFIDPESKGPLENTEVRWRLIDRSEMQINRTGKTDEAGRLVLKLTPGNYRMSRTGVEEDVAVEWTVAGPTTPSIELPQAPQ